MVTCSSYILKCKQKLGFIDGTIPKPTSAKRLADWSTINSMLVFMLLNTILLTFVR